MNDFHALIQELTEKSLSAVNLGHFQTAVTHLEQVATYLRQENPSRAMRKDLTEVLFNLGLYYQQLGAYETAVARLEEVVQLDGELGSEYLSADQTVLGELRQLAQMTPAERTIELKVTEQITSQVLALGEEELEALRAGALRAVMLALIEDPLPTNAENEQLARRLEGAMTKVADDDTMGETRYSLVAYLQTVIAHLRN